MVILISHRFQSFQICAHELPFNDSVVAPRWRQGLKGRWLEAWTADVCDLVSPVQFLCHLLACMRAETDAQGALHLADRLQREYDL